MGGCHLQEGEGRESGSVAWASRLGLECGMVGWWDGGMVGCWEQAGGTGSGVDRGNGETGERGDDVIGTWVYLGYGGVRDKLVLILLWWDALRGRRRRRNNDESYLTLPYLTVNVMG